MIPICDKRWMEYINNKNDASIFHHPCWLENLSKSYGYTPYILVVESPNGEISAGLPVMKVGNLFARLRYISVPFSDYCAPLYDDQESLNLLTQGLINLSHQNFSTTPVELRWSYPAFPEMQPFLNYVLHILPLSSDPEVVFKNFSRNIRHDIREAEEDREMKVVNGNTLEFMQLFYKQQVKTRHRHGVPVQSWKYFKSLQEEVIQKDLGSIWLCYRGETCIAGLVTLCFGKTITFKYLASDEDYVKFHPNHLVFWNAIKWASENEFKKVDFGRSETCDNDKGLRVFKSKWGAFETLLTYTNIVSPPSNLTKSTSMSVMKKVIQKSPLWVCKFLGEILYQYFP